MAKKKSPDLPDGEVNALTRRPIKATPKQKSEDLQKKQTLKDKTHSPTSETSSLYPDLKKELSDDADDLENDNEQNSGDEEHFIENENPQLKKQLKTRYILIFFICIVISTLIYIFNSNSSIKTKEPGLNITHLMKNMKSEFQNQPEYTFRILKSALKHVVNQAREPSAPAVILLLVNKGAEKTGLRFSASLAKKMIGDKYVLIDEDMYTSKDHDIIKEKIDRKIKLGFTNDSLNVAVLTKFEKLPIKAAMLFHNYCDHENALFKRAVYLFLLSMDKTLRPDSEANIDETAMKCLSNLWKDSTEDYFDSLITRLTVSVVNIK